MKEFLENYELACEYLEENHKNLIAKVSEVEDSEEREMIFKNLQMNINMMNAINEMAVSFSKLSQSRASLE